MQTSPVHNLRPLLVAAVIGLVVGWLFLRSNPTPDEHLVNLVEKLTAVQTGSTVLASSIVSAAAILAAILIPVVTVLVVLRWTAGERTTDRVRPEAHALASVVLPAPSVKALAAGKAKAPAQPSTRPTVERRSAVEP